MENRDQSISFIRLLAMCMIVTCHLMHALNMQLAWWFNVGVQIFLCISGYLYANKDTGNLHSFFRRRLIKILVPYYIAFIIYGIIQFFCARSDFNAVNFLRGLVCNSTINGGGHLWFVPTILMCYMLTPILQDYKNNYIIDKNSFLKFSFGAIFVAGIYFGLFEKFFSPAWVSCYVIGYLIGINEKRKYIKDELFIPSVGLLALVGNGLQIYFSIKNIDFPGFGYFNNYNHVLLGVFIFILLKKVLRKFDFGKFKLCLRISDKYSYEVYLVHVFIILGPFSLISVTPIIGLNIGIIIIGITLLAYALKLVENLVLKHLK